MMVLACSLIVTACSGYKPVGSTVDITLTTPYRFENGDVLRITVFEQPDLTNTYKLDKSGSISFPLIGTVPARGKTTEQLETDIAARLRQGYLRNPDVSVEVAEYKPIFVMGSVGTPGQHVYTPGMTVQNAVAAAGGFTTRSQQRNADLTRTTNEQLTTYRVNLSAVVEPGDTIYIRERIF
jgi:polysaccharide export outer membrane protein